MNIERTIYIYTYYASGKQSIFVKKQHIQHPEILELEGIDRNVLNRPVQVANRERCF